MRLDIAMAQFSEKYLAQLAGALYDAIRDERVKPGFTVSDILHAGIPMLTNSLLSAIALEQLIKDGVIKVLKEDGEYRYYLRYQTKKEPEPATEKEPQKMQKEPSYKTRELRAEQPKKTQVGGTHYVNMAIQPVDYITKNNLGFLEGCVVKYVSRWKDKNGKEDLLKARHCIEMLLDGVED